MKRVLNGVHILMAIGLVVALAACGGSDGSLRKERDQAQAAVAAGEIAAAEAAAQAAADKMAAAEAAAEAAAAAQMAADEAAADAAEAAQMAADEAAAEAAAAAQMAADEAAADAAEAATAAQMAADEAAAQAAAALEEALAQAAAAAQMAADEAAAALEEALALAEAEKKALEDELAGVPKTVEELETAFIAADNALTAAQEAMAAADTALEEATAARTAAQTAVDESDAAGLTDAIAALQAARDDESAAQIEAMGAADAVTAAEAEVDAVLAALVATDTGPASEILTAEARKKAIAGARKAFTLLDSIPREAADPVTALPRKETTTLRVSHNGEAAKFSATMTDPDSNRRTTVFSQADENMAPEITGWASATLTGRKDGNKATGLTYSDIAAPKDKLFAVQYGTDGADREFGSTAADTNPEFARSNIPAANEWVGGTAGGSIDGSYRGVEGTFTCSADCPASNMFPERRTGGTVVGTESTDAAISGTWTFEPADENAMVKVQDSDHLSFGYWLSKNSAGDPVGFGVWYAGSKDVAAEMDIQELDEKVTYTGAAAGKYVIQSDVPNLAHAGYFTASAELEADFTAEAGTVGMVEGTISGFKDGEYTPLGDLELTLKAVLSYDTTDNNLLVDGTADTSLVTAASGGLKHGTVGEWEAQFFGDAKPTNVPTGVAGAFNATIDSQAVVVGGFGATK